MQKRKKTKSHQVGLIMGRCVKNNNDKISVKMGVKKEMAKNQVGLVFLF